MSRDIIFISGCLMCPIYQAECCKDTTIWALELRQVLSLCDVNIVQMPCPEASFTEYNVGLRRKRHGINYYEGLSGFVEHCEQMATMVAGQITALYDAGYNTIAIVGIEHSPSCATSYIYTNKGMVRRKGIFIEQISQYLEKRGIEVSYVGVNRRFYNKAKNKLINLLHKE